MKKEFRRIIKDAMDRGWKFKTGNGHGKLTYINGKIAVVSLSPSCPNAHKMLLKDILKIEREYVPKQNAV